MTLVLLPEKSVERQKRFDATATVSRFVDGDTVEIQTQGYWYWCWNDSFASWDHCWWDDGDGIGQESDQESDAGEITQTFTITIVLLITTPQYLPSY